MFRRPYAYRQPGMQGDRQADIVNQPGRQADRHTYLETNRQTDRWAGR